MAFVQFSRVCLAFGDRDILKDVSINLSASSKAALVGENGCGKSTLMKVMAGLITPDSGDQAVQKGVRVSYLPQSGLAHKGKTLQEEADSAFDTWRKLELKAERLAEELKTNKSAALLDEHSSLLEKIASSGFYSRQKTIEQVLGGLGFSRADFDKRAEEFSGGWQMRIALARTLLTSPDILLLDEPTNYLDIDARGWLEDYLCAFKGGFLLVSHDRYFLDHTVTEVYELSGGKLTRFTGNYTQYEATRQVQLDTIASSYERQQQQIEKLSTFVKRFGYKATKASQAQERQKMLDKLLENKIELPASLKRIRFSFPKAALSGDIVLTLKHVSKSYGTECVIRQMDLQLRRGDRLAVAGKNGSGKSTLLRIIAGEDDSFGGVLKLGANVSVGWYSQDSAERIGGGDTALSYLEKRAPLDLIPRLRGMLGSFLFHGDDVFKRLDELSGGEKSRLALLSMLLCPANLLVLDEPTNHLDIPSKDVLLAALKDFGGTVVFVTHDRAFADELATRVIEMRLGDDAREYLGGFEYYMEKRQQQVQQEAQLDSKVYTAAKAESAGKVSWQESKRRESTRRKLQRQVDELGARLEEAEASKRTAEEELCRPDVYSDGVKAKEVQQRIASLEKLIGELEDGYLAAVEAVDTFDSETSPTS